MELKPCTLSDFRFSIMLLIVPYGIETGLLPWQQTGFWPLLIVPYGIETSSRLLLAAFNRLLIVPYGIETEIQVVVEKEGNLLLIVPYGIETTYNMVYQDMPADF